MAGKHAKGDKPKEKVSQDTVKLTNVKEVRQLDADVALIDASLAKHPPQKKALLPWQKA